LAWAQALDEAALEASLPSTLANGAGKLRDYQRQGVTWLLFNWHRARSSLLADEMGLGKTLQTVAFCAQLHEKHGVRGPFLVVAPLSTLPHWQREFQRWSCLDAVRGERLRGYALPVHGQNAGNCRRISWLLAGPVERAFLSCVRVSESLRRSIAHQLTVCLCGVGPFYRSCTRATPKTARLSASTKWAPKAQAVRAATFRFVLQVTSQKNAF
jgi:hypothetical protein